MMKNTEWGAVAYLQHSAYGSGASVRINNNSDYTTGYQANNEPTCGYTTTNEECNKYCNDGTCNTAYPSSTLSSTTGNITGVFDMSGGAWEYVMGAMLDESGRLISGRSYIHNSGFNGIFSCIECDNDTSGLTELTDGHSWPDSKYYDIYSYGSNDQEYQRRILGDATGEMGPMDISNNIKVNSWHNAGLNQYFSTTYPIGHRGYSYNSGYHADIFSFQGTYTFSGYSFRVILTP